MALAMDGSPFELDQAVARAFAALERWEYQAAEEEEAPWPPPLENHRRASGGSTFERLQALSPAEPLRDDLLRWVHRLTSERVNGAARAQCLYLRHDPLPLNEFKAMRSRQQLLKGALAKASERALWLEAFLSHARPLAELEALLGQRRRETARLLGLSQPEELSSPLRPLPETGTARLLLGGTPGGEANEPKSGHRDEGPRKPSESQDGNSALRDIANKTAQALAPHARRLTRGRPADWLTAALGVAGKTFPLALPKRLGPPVLLGYFRETQLFRGLALPKARLATNLGPASLVRNLEKLGQSWHDALQPRDQPFCLAVDPYGLERWRDGALLASQTLCGPFLQRQLGVARSRVAEAQRLLASVWVLELVARCLKVLLSEVAQRDRDQYAGAFEALSAEFLGVALPPSSAGALLPLRPDDIQALAGLALAFEQRAYLTEAHDEDWYRNPRAAEQMRAERARPPETRCSAPQLERSLLFTTAELERLLQ